MTLSPTLLLVRLLAPVVWVGGMFFALFCSRPAASAVLPPPQRIRLSVLLNLAIGLSIISILKLGRV